MIRSSRPFLLALHVKLALGAQLLPERFPRPQAQAPDVPEAPRQEPRLRPDAKAEEVHPARKAPEQVEDEDLKARRAAYRGPFILVPQRIPIETTWQENLQAPTPLALIWNAIRR